MEGRSLQQKHTQIAISTDASKQGYGGHVGNHYIQGTWSESQQKPHQSSGVGGCIPNYETFSSNSQEQDCSNKKRLNYCSTVYHETVGAQHLLSYVTGPGIY